MRISDWSSDVCSSDLLIYSVPGLAPVHPGRVYIVDDAVDGSPVATRMNVPAGGTGPVFPWITLRAIALPRPDVLMMLIAAKEARSEEHTSELQSLMRISYAVFCLKKKTNSKNNRIITINKTVTNESPIIQSRNQIL